MAAPAPEIWADSGRLRLRVRGTVQGVGFRPFAYGLASRLSLCGFVRNDGEGVLIEIEGRRARAFVAALETAPPPLARIDSIEVAAIAPRGGQGFTIEATTQGKSTTRIGADAAVCDDCLDELFGTLEGNGARQADRKIGEISISRAADADSPDFEHTVHS